jgi:hypothetical protein
MEPLDGNAIAGPMDELFGMEMTTASGVCKTCGASVMVGQLRVYMRAPGMVARCPGCENVVFVLIEIRGSTRIDLRNFELTS